MGRISGLGLPLVMVHGGLLWLFDLAARLEASLALLGLGFVALLGAARRLGQLEAARGDADPGAGGGRAPAVAPGLVAGVLLVAALLRALLLPLPPTLSDDLLRYVWDGRVTVAGHNPYLLAPAAEELTPLRDPRWRAMPHKEVPTVYPPLAIGLFSIAAMLPFPMLAVKILLVLADLVTCAMLLVLAAKLGVPASRTVWYAWNPLVVLEVAGMGHVDALAVCGVALALTALLAGRSLAAGVAAAAGALAKLGPLAALPLWARHSRRPAAFLGAVSLLLLAAGLPVALSVGGVPPGLVTYGLSWEFNGPLYEPLWRLLDAADADAVAKGLLDAYKRATEQWTRWNWIFPYLYPQLLAKLLLAGLGGLALMRSVFLRRPVQGTGWLFGCLLLVSATFYPWYLLWVLPWAALALHPAWLTLSATILLSYLPQGTGIELFPWIFLLVWVPFWALLLWRPRWSGTG